MEGDAHADGASVMLPSVTTEREARDNFIDIERLVPGRHYEFEIKPFTAFDGLPVPGGTKRREFIEVMEIGPYRFLKVSRDGGIRHMLAADHILRIRPVGVVIEFSKTPRRK